MVKSPTNLLIFFWLLIFIFLGAGIEFQYRNWAAGSRRLDTKGWQPGSLHHQSSGALFTGRLSRVSLRGPVIFIFFFY